MLGSVASSGDWHWAAHGKHRVAADYFSLGEIPPMLQAFATWVRQGYQELASRQVPLAGYRSWRFWARGAAKGLLVSGLVKDSSDSHGRPFPFLLVGTGPLSDWEEEWDLVPFACERSWSQLERISTRGFETVKELEADLHKIRGPTAEWSAFRAELDGLGARFAPAARAAPGGILEDLRGKAAHIARETDVHISLDEGTAPDQFTLASLWHSLIRESFTEAPHVVFMGGNQKASFLVLFRRALTPTDFVQLWSAQG